MMQHTNTRTSTEKQFAAKALLAMLCVFCIHPLKVQAQMKVGDNPTVINPAAMFEVESTNKGILLPRIFIRDENSFGLVGNTAIDGMFIFNTNPALEGGVGMYYWAKSKWNFIQSGQRNIPVWKILGNGGTDASINFLGTTDSVDLAFRTNNIEHMRIGATGQIGINQNYSYTQQFAVSTNLAGNTAIVGQNIASTGRNGPGIGVLGITAQTYNGSSKKSGYGVVALNKNPNGTGIYAGGNNVGIDNVVFLYGMGGVMVGTSAGVAGYATDGVGVLAYGNKSYGIFANSDNPYELQTGVYSTYDGNNYGIALEGIGLWGGAPNPGVQLHVGVFGSAYHYGVYGNNFNNLVSSAGVLGQVTYSGDEKKGIYPVGVLGNVSPSYPLLLGTADGVAGNTNQPYGAGVFGQNSYAKIGGVAMLGSQTSNAEKPLTLYPAAGAGGAFTGNGLNTDSTTIIGVAGYANYGDNKKGNGTTDYPSFFAGGYFATRISQKKPYNASSYAYVGVQNNGTNYKILGTGNVSTIVKTLNDKKVTLFAAESPESLFEDYGVGKLENGKMHIRLDPAFAKIITVNDKHPLRVFIQLNGDCKGVFVTNKTGNGFDVIELQSGRSNVDFEWHVIGNRADEYDDNGILFSKNADLRMPPAPGPLASKDASNKAKALIVTGDGMHRTAPELKGVKVEPDPYLQKIKFKKSSTETSDNTQQPQKKLNNK